MPLTNRVRGPYRKLRTELFSFGLWPKPYFRAYTYLSPTLFFMARALGARAIKNKVP